MWDLETGAQTSIPSGTTTVSFSHDGKTLASKPWDGFLYLWDVATLENIATLELGYGRSGGFALFSPDGALLASASHHVAGFRYRASLKLWDARTREEVFTFEQDVDVPRDEVTGQITSGVFSADGRLLAVGSYFGIILLVDTVKKEVAATLQQRSRVSSLSFSPDGGALASASEDGIVLLWDIAPYTTPQTPNPDFDGDGTVGFADFVLFAGAFGLSRRDDGYDARYDLDGDGTIGFSDFLIFANNFGRK